MKSLEAVIGHTFADKSLLTEALTHSSYANEQADGRPCNERLEFLGDAVLGFVAARTLFRRFPDMPEGEMTRLRAELVCETALYRAAQRLELSDHILLGKSSGGHARHSVQADCVEAVLAAIYLDAGLTAAERFVHGFILDELDTGIRPHRSDYKTLLQEQTQQGGGHTPTYRIVAQSGPDHCKQFTAEVLLADAVLATGVGSSKKEAEQAAARAALEQRGYDGL